MAISFRRVLGALGMSLVIGLSIGPSDASAGTDLAYQRIIINPNGGSSPSAGPDVASIGNRLYVWAWGEYVPGRPYGQRLWAIDGTNVFEVAPDHAFEGGNRALVFRDRLLFQANAPGVGINDKHIWEYDGSNVQDLGDNGTAGIGGTAVLNGLLYEGDYDGLFVYDGVTFRQLSSEHVRTPDLRVAPDGETLVYVTDGAVRAYDGEAFSTIYTGDNPQFPMVTASHVFFHDSGVLYAYDWATAAMSSIYIGNTNGGSAAPNGVYLSAGGVANYCTPGACQPIIGPATGAYWFTAVGGYVYIVAPDAGGKSQLWATRSGESSAGTVPINPSGASNPLQLRALDSGLFLSADGGDGSGLWQVDGTNARLLAKPNPTGDSSPVPLAATSDSVYFSASDGVVRDLFVVHRFAASAASIAQVLAAPNPLPVGAPATLQAQIDGPVTQVEYFIGDDPGRGEGTAMQLQGVSASAQLPGMSAAGVYEVGVRAEDDAGVWSDTFKTYQVVYDPSAGFATGGGWIVPGSASSDAGDVLPGLDGTSNANFGFVVKYDNGAATVPGGNLVFHYKVGDFRLKSSGMEWLIVTNTNWAKFQGLGEVDGLDGLVAFRVDARDSDELGDRFVVRIWAPGANPDVDEPIYKASGDVGGGQVVIHRA